MTANDVERVARVKELEWVLAPDNVDHKWEDSTLVYQIEDRVLFIGHQSNGLVFDSDESAKAAAQADYERRILSAIEPAPMDVAEAARVLLDEAERFLNMPAPSSWPKGCKELLSLDSKALRALASDKGGE